MKKITADTNLLVRVAVQDDPTQAQRATRALADASLIAIPIPVFCEFVWVLRRIYGFATKDIANAIGHLLAVSKVVTDRSAVDAGLAVLEAGGDFADGAIAYVGAASGSEIFVSFDATAVKLIAKAGMPAKLL
jgi:predicted nucleic-acid-binding protein